MKSRNWLSGRTKRPPTTSGRWWVHFPLTSMPIRCASIHLGAGDLHGLSVALRIGFQQPRPLVPGNAERIDSEVFHALDDVGELHHLCDVGTDLHDDLPRRSVG